MNARMESAEADVERLRPRLLALAYRMLGSAADAEDAVQDAYLRYQQVSGVEQADAWLVKATTRLCIDRLRQAKRRETYIGPWLPEPVAESWAGAEADRLEMAESLSMAFLVLLETLSPAERAAYLLREVFGYEFDEIATLIDKTPVNVRQIVARARKRVENNDRRFQTTTEQAEALANRFFEACRSGDVDAIESLLAPDAVLYSDGGGKAHAAPRPLTNRRQIAKLFSVVFPKAAAHHFDVARTRVNGRPGVVVSIGGRVVEVFTFDEFQGRVGTLYVVLNPDKLERWPFPGPDSINDPADEPQV